ncbi:MAG: urease accessory protein UreF [Chitinophagaceae bacterium]
MNSALLSLLQLSDPALPIGGYAHSAGLETYVQSGVVKDMKSAKEFVVEMISQNLHHTDAALVSLSYDAALNNDYGRIEQLDTACTAVKLPKEMRIASNKLGLRLIKIFQTLAKTEIAVRYAEEIKKQTVAGHYCIAFGLYAQGLGVPKKQALTGFYYNAAAGFVTNSVKLVPLSQQHGQEILFSLHSLVEQLVNKNMNPDEELIGLCCSGFDIRSMQHERLYSRLYMS